MRLFSFHRGASRRIAWCSTHPWRASRRTEVADVAGVWGGGREKAAGERAAAASNDQWRRVAVECARVYVGERGGGTRLPGQLSDAGRRCLRVTGRWPWGGKRPGGHSPVASSRSHDGDRDAVVAKMSVGALFAAAAGKVVIHRSRSARSRRRPTTPTHLLPRKRRRRNIFCDIHIGRLNPDNFQLT